MAIGVQLYNIYYSQYEDTYRFIAPPFCSTYSLFDLWPGLRDLILPIHVLWDLWYTCWSIES